MLRRRKILGSISCVMLTVVIGGCALFRLLSDSSIVHGESADPLVTNGIAFEQGTVDLVGRTKLALPALSLIRRSNQPGKIQLFLAKRLGYFGHPDKPITIDFDARTKMGCAIKADGDTLKIATFGEWDSHIEGGADINLLAVVPEGVDVERHDDLAGEHSIAIESAELSRKRIRSKAEQDQWWQPEYLAEGWRAVSTTPDPKQTAPRK